MTSSAAPPRLAAIVVAALGVVLMVAMPRGMAAPTQEPEVVNLWPGAAPGTEDWDVREYVGRRSVTNVTVPTLTVHRPQAALATGAAMIVVPGGGFQGLALAQESAPTVTWLRERGITAIALKYRVRVQRGAQSAQGESFDQREQSLVEARDIAVADGLQAMRVVRDNAQRFGVDPERVGMIGFSAGAMTTLGVIARSSKAERPAIAAALYGSMADYRLPEGAPPLFIAHAQDDEVVPVAKSLEVYARWTAAGLPVELHIFERGGHGFGALRRGHPTDLWMAAFEHWLRQHGWLPGME